MGITMRFVSIAVIAIACIVHVVGADESEPSDRIRQMRRDPSQPWFSACPSGDTPRRPAPSIAAAEIARFGSARAHSAAIVKKEVINLEIVPGLQQECPAYGFYLDTIEENGWSYLYIASNSTFDDDEALYASGFLEGALTATRIYQHVVNSFADNFPNSTIPILTQNWVEDMLEYNGHQMSIATEPGLWTRLRSIFSQVQGLSDGQISVTSNTSEWLTPLALQYLQLSGDIGDIAAAADPSLRPHPTNWTLAQIMDREMKGAHCSSLVKVVPSTGELWHSHNTWWSFVYMLRVYKMYDLPLFGAPGITTHFSSYPGLLDSMDDFYTILETKLSVAETTNEIQNPALYDLCNMTGIATWARAIIANRYATSGEEWSELYSVQNTGTYNNQWMIVDHKLYTPFQPLPPGVLFVVSQEPGLIITQDVTEYLTNFTYWASYNRPFELQIFKDMGYPFLMGKYGVYLYSYDESFRARLFRREQENIVTLEDMKRVMSLNRWQTDPLSDGCASLALAARNDLTSNCPAILGSRGTNGNIDVKITSHTWMMAGKQEVLAISGPTHTDQVPFSWIGKWNYKSHVGHPDTFNFDWQTFPPWITPSQEVQPSQETREEEAIVLE